MEEEVIECISGQSGAQPPTQTCTSSFPPHRLPPGSVSQSKRNPRAGNKAIALCATFCTEVVTSLGCGSALCPWCAGAGWRGLAGVRLGSGMYPKRPTSCRFGPQLVALVGGNRSLVVCPPRGYCNPAPASLFGHHEVLPHPSPGAAGPSKLGLKL